MIAEQDTSGSDKLLRYGRPQAWARGGTCPPSGNVVKCFAH